MGATRHDALNAAYRLCREHRALVLRVASVKDFVRNPIGPDFYVDAYVLYRNHRRVGKRREPADLLRLIKGEIERAKPKPTGEELAT